MARTGNRFGQFDYPSGDRLPRCEAGVVSSKRESSDLSGNEHRSTVTVPRQNLVGAGPQFPVREH